MIPGRQLNLSELFYHLKNGGKELKIISVKSIVQYVESSCSVASTRITAPEVDKRLGDTMLVILFPRVTLAPACPRCLSDRLSESQRGGARGPSRWDLMCASFLPARCDP